MKKLEIIIESVEISRVIKIIDACQAAGYTKINDVAGRGERGRIASAGLSDILNSSMIIVVDSENIIQKIIDKIKPILRDYSGIMFVSDVEVYHGE